MTFIWKPIAPTPVLKDIIIFSQQTLMDNADTSIAFVFLWMLVVGSGIRGSKSSADGNMTV